MDEWAAERILTCVEQVPLGRVVSYGDVAELTATTPRQVGAVMRLRGAAVAWWRVINASGRPPQHLLDEVADLWAAEGIKWKAGHQACDLGRYRADLGLLDEQYRSAIAEIDSPPQTDPAPQKG